MNKLSKLVACPLGDAAGASPSPITGAPANPIGAASPEVGTRPEGRARHVPSTFSRIARVSGEAFDCDQISWSCEDCGRDEYCCECELPSDLGPMDEGIPAMSMGKAREAFERFFGKPDGWERIEL